MKRILSGIAFALLITGQAAAAEVVTTAGAARAAGPPVAGPAVVPPLGAPQPAIDEAAGPTPPPGQSRCSAAAPADLDRRPHGEVWAGVGTHGYRDVGTAMTAPVGKCGSVSIAIDRAEGSDRGWRR